MVVRIVPVIMSGGAGTRLWPLSTPERPKQFQKLGAERSLLQDTLLRFRSSPPAVQFADPIIVASAQHAAAAAEECAQAGVRPSEIILEPEGRNTAATAALAAAAVQRCDPEALALLAPADHRIADSEGFCAAVAKAAPLALARICTFGIRPSRPETGYGYIQAGPPLAEGVFTIASFKEKPQRAVAEEYLAAGGYFWNAGIFLFSPRIVLQEFGSGAAPVREVVVRAYAAAAREGVFTRLGQDFLAAPALPFDVAVMEKTQLGAVVPCAIGWADIGSWLEVHSLSAQDFSGNATEGAVVLRDVRRSLVLADRVVVAAAGVDDLVIVATPEAVLVLPKERAQDVKVLLEAVRALPSQR